MCFPEKLTKRKSAIIYKVVVKYENNYYGLYSGVKIKLGTLNITDRADWLYQNRLQMCNESQSDNNGESLHPFIGFDERIHSIYTGRVSGFLKYHSAIILYNEYHESIPVAILRLKVSNPIYSSNAEGIIHRLHDEIVLYGSNIDSIEKIKYSKIWKKVKK